jgi:hypothetical protein
MAKYSVLCQMRVLNQDELLSAVILETFKFFFLLMIIGRHRVSLYSEPCQFYNILIKCISVYQEYKAQVDYSVYLLLILHSSAQIANVTLILLEDLKLVKTVEIKEISDCILIPSNICCPIHK